MRAGYEARELEGGDAGAVAMANGPGLSVATHMLTMADGVLSMTNEEINSMTEAQLRARLDEIKAELLKLIAAASAVGGCQTRKDATWTMALVKEAKQIGTKLGLPDHVATVR